MKKQKKDSKFEAIVEMKIGTGKKARTVEFPVRVNFYDIPSWVSDVEHEVTLSSDYPTLSERVVNKKELKAAYKAWLKG